MSKEVKDAPKVQEVQTISNLQRLQMSSELGKIQKKLQNGNKDGATNAMLKFAKTHESTLRNNPELTEKVESLSDLIFKTEEKPAEKE